MNIPKESKTNQIAGEFVDAFLFKKRGKIYYIYDKCIEILLKDGGTVEDVNDYLYYNYDNGVNEFI